jgi:fibronectin type 3 domain-containing protein
MRSEKWWIRDKKLLLTSYFLLLIFIVSCGRRGDPVAIIPYEVGVDSYREVGVVKDSKASTGVDVKPEQEKVEIISPEAPAGFVAVYTQKSIVLTWDEIHGQGIGFYRVYRSEGRKDILRPEGEDFFVIGETVTSAFTDKDVEPSKKYYYRVTAVGETEGPPSKEIEVVTEVH